MGGVRHLVLFVLIITIGFISVTTLAEETNNIQAELEANLRVDAVVDAPVSDNLAAPLIQVARFVPDLDRAQSIWFPGLMPPNDEKNDQNPNYRYVTYENGGSLSVNDGTIYYGTPAGEIVSQLYALEWILNDAALNCPDLPFADRETVAEQTLATLSELGFTNLICTDIYALTTECLQAASDDMAADEYASAEIKAGRIVYKEKWLPEDACYVLEFQFSFGGIPVFSNDSIRSIGLTEIHYDNYEMKAVVSKDGIIYLYAYNAIHEAASEQAETLMPPERLIEHIANYYENIIIEYPSVISKIALRYILQPVSDNNAYELLPAWCCELVSQDSMQNIVDESWVVFDARNGNVCY